MEKIKNMNNLPMKIICIALAVILWFYVSYEENPSMTKTVRNVPLAITGEQALKENGFSVYSVSEKSLNVSVTAKRLALARITNKSLSAVINVSSLKQSGEYTIPATVSSTVSSNASYYVKGPDIKVIIEPFLTEDHTVSANISNSGESTLIIRSMELSLNKTKLSAPESILKEVDQVTTREIIPNNRNTTQIKNEPLIVLGKDGKILEGVICDPSTVDISYTFYDVKTVPIVLSSSFPANGRAVLSQSEITLYGYGEDFNDITSVHTEEIDLSNYSGGSKVKTKLILPSGVRATDGITEIEVSVLPQSPKDD